MKKLIQVVSMIAFAVLLSACGRMVEVPPAHVAKTITKTGYADGVIGTSKFRLELCVFYCDKLAILQIADRSVVEELELFMPKDKLILSAEVKATLSIDQSKTEELFNTIPPVTLKNGVDVGIPWESIYVTYAQQIITITAREYLTQFSINEVASNMETINNELGRLIQEQLHKKTPFVVRNVGLTKVIYPPVITDAQINAAERREDLQREEANLQNAMVRLERELKEAQLQRQIDLEKAQGEAAAHKIQSAAIDSKVLELRRIENERLMIEKWSGNLPTTMLGDTVPMINLGK